MRQHKISRDGIHIYRSHEQQQHTRPAQTNRFLLAALQLTAVLFLAAAWWENLTSVFPISVDTFCLYCVLFFYTAVLTFLWNMPLRFAGKLILLALLGAAAGCWIWRHLDAAVNVINSAANAYLSVCLPRYSLYPVTPVSDVHMAVMTGLFLMPLLLIWSLSLHIHRERVFSMLLLLAPATLSLITIHVPSELSCWLVILSGVFFCFIYKCKNGRAAFVNAAAGACILAVIAGISVFASRPLERYKQSSDGFYAETRVYIQTRWIAPVTDYIKDAQENRRRKNDSKDTENTKQTDAGNTNIRGADVNDTNSNDTDINNTNINDTDINDIEINDADAGLTGRNASHTDDTPDSMHNDSDSLPSDVIVDIPDHAVENPLFSTDGNASGNNGANSTGTHTNSFPNLNSLSHFQPDYGVRMTISVDKKPEDTYYHPVSYGGIYAGGRWHEIQTADDVSEEYLQYPDTLSRLEEFCLTHNPETLEGASDFIQQEFKENTVYDYEPGAVPSGQDFAEYFLFENRKGFCVHFATTAALMYRICGFPSRYVHGYAIPASAFHRQEDGSYLAEVTGDMGHAWCEVYSDSQWILKEHTLPYYGTRPTPGTPAAASEKRTWIPNTAGRLLLALKLLIKVSICLLIAAVLLLLQAAFRRQRRYQRFQKRQDGAGIQKIYRAIYDAAVFHGMQKTDILNREGFRSLQNYCPEMDADSMEWLYEAVMETMFYKREITKEELRRARKLYQQFSRLVKKDLSLYQKFIYLYIKVL